jgi:CHAT domain-containing protein
MLSPRLIVVLIVIALLARLSSLNANPIQLIDGHKEQVNPASADPFPVTTHPEADIMPALSPNGQWIAFVSRQNKNYDAWVKPAHGGIATALTTHTSDDYSPAWSPDGRRLVFISRRDDAEGDLYLLEVKYHDGNLTPGKIKRLTSNLQREAFPVFSPDGKKIAYSAGPTGREHIWLYEIKTGKSYPLTRNGGTQPAWSPDGTELAISSPVSNFTGNQIFIIKADTAQADHQRRQITVAGDNHFPIWSPDGKNILVQRFEIDGGQSKSHLRLILATATAAASNQELQLTPTSENALFPNWGKNRAIYYAADHYGNLDLWRVPESGRISPSDTPAKAFAAAQAITDPEIAVLAFSALPFYFPDSLHWMGRAGVEIGRRYLALGDTAEAKVTFEKIAREYAGQFEAAAVAEIELAKLAGATNRFVEIGARHPQWPAVQAFCALETGKALQSAGKLETALRYYQSLSPQDAGVREACYEALLHAGDILIALGRTEEGEASYVEIITNYGEWRAVAINRLLDAAPQSSIAPDTLAAYQRVIQEYAAQPAISFAARFRIAERLVREGEHKLAENEYKGLIESMAGQSDPFLRNLRAEAMARLIHLYIKDNEFTAATQLYQKLLEEHSDPAELSTVREPRRELSEALIRRARLLMQAQDFELALTQFLQARQYDPRNVETHRGCVEAMYTLSRIDEAIDEYSHWTAKNPEDESVLYALGLAYSYKGENDTGLLRRSSALIERALAMNYRLVPAYLTLSFNYEAIEKLQQKERARKKGFFEAIAFALPNLLDNVWRTVTFRPPKPPERWYEKAIDALTIAIALNDEKADPQREAQLALNLANNYYNFGEFGFENAYRYYRIRLQYDSTFASTKQKAVVYERIGECGWASGHYDEAAPFLRQAVDLYRSFRDVEGELRNLQRLALLYQASGDYETSIEYYRQVINVSRRENRTENLALAWRNIAYNHQQLAETDEAIAKSERSIGLIEQAGKGAYPQPRKSKLIIKLLGLPIFWWTVDPMGESSVEGLTFEQEQGLVFSIIEESNEARKDFREAIAALENKAENFRRRKNRLGEAIALNNLGILWYNLHELDKAAEKFLASLRICARQNFQPGKVVNLINLGNLGLLQQQWGDETIRLSIDSLLQASRADIEQVALQSPRQKLAVLNTLGNLYYYTAQRALFEDTGDENNRADYSNSQGNHDLSRALQQSLQALQNLAWACATYDTALTIAQANRLTSEEIIVRRNLACALILAGDYAPALEQLHAAHQICIEKNYRDLTWRVEHAIGTACRLVNMPTDHALARRSPLEWYRSAIRILESLPEEPEAIEQRITETEEQYELYENTITLLAERGESSAALALAERASGNRFVNLAATRYILPKKERHRLIWGGGGGLAADQRRILSRLQGELRKLEAEDPQRPKELARVRKELAEAEREYQDIITEALAEDPELASFFSVQAVDLKAVQDSLDQRTAILRYFVAENELIVWLIAKDYLEQKRVPISRPHLRNHVAQLRHAWLERNPNHSKLAAEMGALLLDAISGLEEYSRLIIVPDDCLHYLPFAALPYQGDLLVDQFTLVHAPSLLALKFAERLKNLNADNLLLVTDAETRGEGERGMGRTGEREKGRRGGEETESQTVAHNFVQRLTDFGLNVRELRGGDWRSGEVRQQIQQAGLLHLRHRFVAQPERPLDSGFVLHFAGDDSASKKFAVVPMYRFFELDLNTSLVVLENTSFPYAADHTGDEMIALQRSLIYAGAPSVVLCQWEIPPAVRERFFESFYANLARLGSDSTELAEVLAGRDKSLAEALSAAQHAVRERYPDPYYWAGFELLGFPGMSAEEKSDFARRHFIATVVAGNKAQELGEHLDAVRYYQTALTMAQQLGDGESVLRLYLLIKASAINGKDYATACEIETKILENAIAANEIKQQAQSYRNLSAWQVQLKNYAVAIEHERKYLALAERVNNPLAVANSQLQLAQIYQAAGDYANAILCAEKAAGILAERQQILPRFNAEILLGKLALEDDRYAQALAYLDPAINTFQSARHEAAALTPAEQRALATAHQLLGAVYSRLTAYRQSLDYHNRALQIFAAIADTANIARAEQFVAETHWLNADYQNALFHQQRALKLSEPLGDELLRIRGQTAMGLILLSLGESDRALDAQKQALQIALELEDKRETEARREQATVHKNLGLVYVQQQQHPQALASFRQAANIDEQFKFERGLLYDYLFLGQAHQALAQPDSALIFVAKAETLAVKLNDHRAYAKALYAQGLAALNRGNKTLARAGFEEALNKSEETKLDEVQWRCLWQLGVMARQDGQLEAALDFYQRAIAAIERLSAKIKIEEYRSGFIDNKSEIYEEAVLLLLQMKREAEAFAMAERAKSRSFADMLANSGVDWQAGADRALLDRRERIVEAISLIQGKITALQAKPDDTERTRLQIAAMNDSLATLQKEYADLLVEIKAANPELADAVSVDPLPITEVQAMLADSVALVEYFFAKDRLVCWVVDRNQSRAVATPLDRTRLNESIVQFRKAIQKRASTESFSRELYDLLVKPIEPLLTSAAQLIIVPHGILHYLPFPALQKADGSYLIDHHALALAPSATVFGFCHRKNAAILAKAEESYRVLALGNPDVGNPRLDLPFTEKEIKSLEQTFGEVQSYTRKQATQSALASAVDEANLIHFSCHGVYDDRNPLFSALLLAPEPANPDGRLEAHEIFSLKLNASLVMLSACETGLARVTGGDEVIGLARSFIFAGAPSLIASLWTVDDLATAITVKRFYRYLKSGLSKAAALREAQRFVRDNHNRHPAYWASFGLTGEWR